jgi:predicted acetyltransferase
MMARCIDAATALQALTVPEQMPDGEVTLLLSDKLIALNNYLLKLTISGGQLTMALTDAAEDVTMGMGAFTQLYFGAFSATELAAAGRIKVRRRKNWRSWMLFSPSRETILTNILSYFFGPLAGLATR